MNRDAVPPAEPADLVTVSSEPIDVGALTSFVAHRAAGAVVVFTGTVRDHSSGREGVTHLEYETYGGVVEDKIAEVVAELHQRWPDVLRVAAVHRVGSLGVGEIAVGIAVSSPHRAEAFAAGEYLIDQIKHRAPIWKKEHWPGGSEWVREDEQH
jgi:molybdopterin synthase catalytic subunit